MSRGIGRITALTDLRFWLVAAALALTLFAITYPRLTLARNVYDVLAVIDITSSMTTRDETLAGKPVSRLDAAKSVLRETLAKLPCQSRLGLGIFTERRTFLLFDPVEVCENFAAIDGAIGELDWRMAWEGDSYIAKGLFSAIDIAKGLDADLMFFTDGHEMPPLPYSGLPPFVAKKGDVAGLIVGVGGRTQTPLIKHDDAGREIGAYSETEIPQENREGPPPPDAAMRPGFHPKWAPFGNAVVHNGEHLAFVREPHLKDLAAVTGLTYVLLDPGDDLVAPLASSAHSRQLEVPSDISAWPAAGALLLLVILYGLLPLLDARRASALHASSSAG